ncbi:hypothetical protein [Crocosphaera sp. Alani8]|uniref:hypothetical protein n=1 Tax=Crocosphaera sp. Alani8 TaxID=3038952 RepID=UPI00313B1EB9
MIYIGMLVHIVYPNYVKGMEGYIQAQENSARWLVRLKQTPFNPQPESIILSLEESDFEVIEQ